MTISKFSKLCFILVSLFARVLVLNIIAFFSSKNKNPYFKKYRPPSLQLFSSSNVLTSTSRVQYYSK